MGHIGKLIILLGLPCYVQALSIEPYPGSVEVKSTNSSEVTIHRLVTGQVKRVNGQVVPESSDYVRGEKSTQTFEMADVRRSSVVSQFFQEQLRSLGQILFECIGRDCGPSNYWANSVFKESILYGPTEDQHYLFGKLNGDKGDYVIIYLAQRATGARYAHIEVITDVGGDRIIDGRLISSALRLQRRFVLASESDQDAMSAVRDVINEDEWKRLAIVAHDALEPNESIEAARKRTELRAVAVKSTLEDMGADTRKLTAIGAGPIAPIDRSNRRRLELVLLD